MLNSITEKFSKPKSKPISDEPVRQKNSPIDLVRTFGHSDTQMSELSETSEIEPCPKCHGSRWWLPRGQSIWRCERCDRPASDGLVADRRNNDPVILSEFVVTCCAPWCLRCGGWQGREITWSDDRIETICESCNAMMPDWPEIQETSEEPEDNQNYRFDTLKL